MLALWISLLALAAAPFVDALLRPQPRVAAGLDAFATVVIAGIVLLQVIPYGLEVAGWPSLVAVALGALLPVGCGWLPRGDLAVVMLATFALGIHGLLDGAALASAQEPGAEALAHAVVLHSLPVGLGVWRAVRLDHGTRAAAAVLALSIVAEAVGYGVADRLQGASTAGLGIAQGLVAGSLLHLIGHRHGVEDRRASGVGALVGLLAAAWLLVEHPLQARSVAELDLTGAWLALAAEAAPALALAACLVLVAPRAVPRLPGWIGHALLGNAPGLPALAIAWVWLGPVWAAVWAIVGLSVAFAHAASTPAAPAPGVGTAPHAALPWLVAGLGLAAMIEAIVPLNAAPALAAPVAWCVFGVLGWLAAPAGVGLVPVLAVLVHKGFPVTPALWMLAVGTVRLSALAGGARVAALVLAGVAAAGASALTPASPALHPAAAHVHDPLELGALALLGLLFGADLLSRGLGGFLDGYRLRAPPPAPAG